MTALRYKKLSEDILGLSYAHEGDAAFDLRSSINYVLQPQQRFAIPTGIALQIPEGYAGLVIPRSGLALKYGISIVNAPGLIDSGYRGEIKVILLNTSLTEHFEIHTNDRIAQLMIVPFVNAQLESCLELEDSQRGTAGFGSSGIK